MTQINWNYQVNNRAGGYIVTATDWNDLAGDLRALIDQTTSSTTDNTPLPLGIDLVNDRVYISDPDSTTPEDGNHADTTLSVVGTTTLAGNTQQTGTFTVGVDDTGYDVKAFGATSGSYMLWDQSADALLLNAADLTVGGGDLSLGSTTASETLVVGGVATTSGAGSSLKIKGGDATGTNQTGNWLVVQPGLGTGTGTSGDILFYTGPAGSSGTSQNTATKAMTITSAQNVTMENDLTVGTTNAQILGPAAGSATSGAVSYSFSGDDDSGIYRSTADTVVMATGGAAVMTWDASQQVKLNDASVYNIYSNGDNLLLNCAAGSAHYVRVNNTTVMNINATGVAIGAGDANASSTLDVTGTMEQDTVVGRIAPTGVVLPFAGGSIPSGWLLCAGTAVSRTTYANLFAVIGTTYGVGDGSSTFNLPDMQGRVPAGVNTGLSDFVSLNTKGGAATVTLSSSEMPAHGHEIYGSTGGGASPYRKVVTSLGDNYTGGLYTVRGTSAEMQHVGGGGAHNNLQPYITLYYIIAT